MSIRLGTVVLNVSDIRRSADFWCGALGYQPRDGSVAADDDFVVLTSGSGPGVSLQLSDRPHGAEPNRVHLDLYSDDQAGEVVRLLSLGARRADWTYEEGDDFIVLLDPDGNEFCVIDQW